MIEPDHLVLVYLRRVDGKIDRLMEDMRGVKVRLTSVEENLVVVHRRLDPVEARLDRIECRLDLADAPH